MALHSLDRERTVDTPEDTLRDAYARFAADRIAISFSGAEDVVLIGVAQEIAVLEAVGVLGLVELGAE